MTTLARLEEIARAAATGPWSIHALPKTLWVRAVDMAYVAKLEGGEVFRDANAEHIAAFDPPTALAMLAVCKAARGVALSNGFDAALPDKQEALRAAVKALEALKP